MQNIYPYSTYGEDTAPLQNIYPYSTYGEDTASRQKIHPYSTRGEDTATRQNIPVFFSLHILTIAIPSFFDRKTAQNSKNKPENLR